MLKLYICHLGTLFIISRVLSSHFVRYFKIKLGRYTSVAIVTRYCLDGPGMKSLWWQDFPHLSRPALGPIQPPMQLVPGFFPDGKAPWAWGKPPTTI
jgi:hypothetical protein